MLSQTAKLKVGDWIAYERYNGHYEIGRIKSMRPDSDLVFVVYHCDGRWKDYKNYTGAATTLNDLTRLEDLE